MLAARRDSENCSDAMDLRRIIPSDITASAIAHLSLLTLLLLFSDVHPFGSVTAEQIPVEIVTPQDLVEKQDLPKSSSPPNQRLPRKSRNRRQRRSRISPCSTGLLRRAHLRRQHNFPRLRRRRSRLPWPLRPRPVASGGSAQATGGGTWLQAARARSVDQIPGVAGLAAGSVANPAAGSGAGSRQGRRQF